MNKKLTLLIIFFVFLIIFFVCLIVFQQRRGDSYIAGLEKILIDECGGREATAEEYGKLNGRGVVFYPFSALLQSSDYYNNDKCALYLKYKDNELEKYSSELNSELNGVLYYQESYMPSNESMIKGCFQLEVREYNEESDCIDSYDKEYSILDEYYQKLLEDGYSSDFGSYEKWSPGIAKQSNYLIFCEYQQNSNNIWGEVLIKNESYYTRIKYSFEDCDECYDDFCDILDYMSIPRPKDLYLE